MKTTYLKRLRTITNMTHTKDVQAKKNMEDKLYALDLLIEILEKANNRLKFNKSEEEETIGLIDIEHEERIESCRMLDNISINNPYYAEEIETVQRRYSIIQSVLTKSGISCTLSETTRPITCLLYVH